MAKQTINLGATANDGTGDPLRTAFDKSNDNFTELYNQDSDFRVIIDSDESHIARLDSDLAALSINVNTQNVKIIGDEDDLTWVPQLTSTGNANLLIRTDTANDGIGPVLGQGSITIGPDEYWSGGYYKVNLGGPHAVAGDLPVTISAIPSNSGQGYNHDVRRFHEGYFEALDVDDIAMMGTGTLYINDSSELEVKGRAKLLGPIASLAGPTSSVGDSGDVAAMVRYDDNYIYRSVADYDGTTNIWKRAKFEKFSAGGNTKTASIYSVLDANDVETINDSAFFTSDISVVDFDRFVSGGELLLTINSDLGPVVTKKYIYSKTDSNQYAVAETSTVGAASIDASVTIRDSDTSIITAVKVHAYSNDSSLGWIRTLGELTYFETPLVVTVSGY